jgi:hypothetical protein
MNTPLRKIPLNPPFTKGEDLAPSFGKGGQGRILMRDFFKEALVKQRLRAYNYP